MRPASLAAASAAAAAAAVLVLWRRRRARALRPPQLAYGTAGFRADAALLAVALERVGVVAALRSDDVAAATGVMVTASHNPIQDNGAKIVDADGGMLDMKWEPKAEAVAQCSEDELAAVVARVFSSWPAHGGGTVVVGRDTRPHSARLAALVVRGARRFGAIVVDVGVVTTPQLHHCVKAHNASVPPAALYGYTEGLADAFEALVGAAPPRKSAALVVDCAGGVGALSVVAVAAALHARGLDDVLQLSAANAPGGAAPLNDKCGAEFVQKQQEAPFGVAVGLERVASLDGDADRLVYCYRDGRGFNLMDGDKIATLLASFVSDEVRHAGLEPAPKIGVVQTAYANGAAALYLKKALPDVALAFAKTGVKYVHHAATAFDVGVYFEANGHGTVLFSEALRARLHALAAAAGPAAAKTQTRRDLAVRRLFAFAALANPSVGDAVADVLLVEAVLTLQKIGVEDWDATYSEFPSRQLKQKVATRAALTPNSSETRLLAPQALQAAVDAAVKASTADARAFVRPSGTEDVVRVYAEAKTQIDADALALEVQRAVFDLADGIGPRP